MILIRDLRCGTVDIPQLEIEPGLTTVIGGNGSGKTTFLNLCAGLAREYSGTISISGREPGTIRTGYVSEFPEKTMLFQDVFGELASPLRFSFRDDETITKEVTALCESLGIETLLEKRTNELSGGEKAIISLATAMIHEPEILVLDEFDSHLDQDTIARCSMILGHCNAPYILHCTQNADLCTSARTVLFFSRGKVLHAGRPGEVFEDLKNTCFYPPGWRFGYDSGCGL